jgi:glycosyltransferase involved in cell wall biosynthesis
MERAVAGVKRSRLLFLCQTLPYPPDGGVWIRTYHILRLLAREFDITALCFERAAMPGNPAAGDVAASREALGRFAKVEVFPVPQRQSRIRYLWDHVRSSAMQRVYTTYLYESHAFRRRLESLLLTETFDLVHLDSLDLVGYLPAVHGIPVVCVHHDVESALLRRRADVERNELRRVYLRHQARLMEAAERRWCGRLALNVAVSEEDRLALQRIAPASRVAIVPNGVDVEEFRFCRDGGAGVAYVGGLHWFPNLDALEFFGAEILPHLRAANAELPVRWIGSASEQQQQHYRDRFGVEVTGYVDDVRPFMRQAACHIVPLRAGGGTRLKILNSWAMGKPVVATSVGCEGLDAIQDENILIRDAPKDFAAAVLMVLRDSRLSRRLGENGFATAHRRYSWDVIGCELIDTYLNVSRRRCA